MERWSLGGSLSLLTYFNLSITRISATLSGSRLTHLCCPLLWPHKAQFTDFKPFWEFVAGPKLRDVWTERAWQHLWPAGSLTVCHQIPELIDLPSEGLQFFGMVDIDGTSSNDRFPAQSCWWSRLYYRFRAWAGLSYLSAIWQYFSGARFQVIHKGSFPPDTWHIFKLSYSNFQVNRPQWLNQPKASSSVISHLAPNRINP